MIKIEKVKNEYTGVEIDYVSADSIAVATIGMRNAKNSWNKSDSEFLAGYYVLGDNDEKLATTLAQAGPVHGKFLRQIYVSANITAPLYWWKEFDTYKVGTTANSTSTMHKLTSREITIDDLSCDKCIPEAKKCLEETLVVCNSLREKYLEANEKHEPKAREYWYSLIQTLPSSYNQTRTVTMNYENLSNMYEYRKHHKLDEWREFCEWIDCLPYADSLIKRENEVKKEQTEKSKVLQVMPKVEIKNIDENDAYKESKNARDGQGFTWGNR